MNTDRSQTTRTRKLAAKTISIFQEKNPFVRKVTEGTKDASDTTMKIIGDINTLCCNYPQLQPEPEPEPPAPPTGLPSASLWFDAADPANISVSSGNITGFTDKTGNSNNGTAFNGTPIAYNTNPINGLGTVRIDNASGSVELLKVTNENFNDQYLTYAIVARWISGGSGIVATDTPGLYGRGIGVTDQGSGIGKLQTISYDAFTTWDSSPDILINQNAPFILITSVSAGNWIASMNGTQYTLPLSQAKTPDNSTGLNIGCWNPSNYGNLRIDIGEVLVYRSFLSTTEIEKVEGYFATKWGLLGNLPGGHPYKLGYP
jgi:hypothetical protein